MAQGSLGKQKIVNKAEHFSSHGKRPTNLYILRALEREKIKRPKPEMYDSVAEAFNAARTKKGKKK